MKKSTIWAISIVMGLSFLGLLYLQFSYVEEMVKMKKEQFDESVYRSLYQASRNLEVNETQRYLEKDVNATERRAFSQDSVMVDGLDGSIRHSHQFAVAADDGTVYSSFQVKAFEIKPASVPKAMILRKDKSSISAAAKSMQEIVRNRYIYQKALLDEVIYNILYTASDKPLKERVNFRMLDRDIRTELQNNGINIPYHFTVNTTDGREVYRCPVHARNFKKAKGRLPGWSYMMNQVFGYASNGRSVHGFTARCFGSDIASRSPDKVLLFAEVQGADIEDKKNGISLTTVVSGSTETDAVLEYTKEQIGFTHPLGKGKYGGNVAFADGHVDTIVAPSSKQFKELTEDLCQGVDVPNNGSYRR